MSSFKAYAEYYDLLYRDKDYAGEAAFVQRCIREHAPDVRSILELGCGTARHACEFVRRGWQVLAVDKSIHMIRRAKTQRRGLPARLRVKLHLRVGKLEGRQARGNLDAVVSLFHAVNYLTTDARLLGLFRSARLSLRRGGLFMFDFWYGPAVRADPPEVRVRRAAEHSLRVLRLAEPFHDPKRHRVDVNFTFVAHNRHTKQCRFFEEEHSVRYLFLPEIMRFAKATGFAMIESGQWPTRKPLSARTWLGYAILRAVDT